APLLQAMLRPLAERSSVGLLADERDRPGGELEREPLEPIGRTREVGATKVAGPARRPRGGVGQADPVVERLELLVRTQEPGREAGGVEQPPEVVPRIREMGSSSRRDEAGVDPAEDDV